jgi:hypothetical protein
MSETLQLIVEDLQNQGNWRREKATEYSEDVRNSHAVAIFDQLLDQVGKIKVDHPLLRKLDAVNDQKRVNTGSCDPRNGFGPARRQAHRAERRQAALVSRTDGTPRAAQ